MAVPRALLVDADAAFGAIGAAVLGRHADEVLLRDDVAGVRALLRDWQPDLVVVALSLADGGAEDVLALLGRATSTPPTIVTGNGATPERAFHLGRLGVRCLLTSPVGARVLDAAVAEALARRVDPLAEVRAAVGKVSLPELEGEVRRTMIDEAIRRSAGNRRRAAALLGVSRQFLQHALRRLDDG